MEVKKEQNKEIKKLPHSGMTSDRRKRINRLKKIIVWTVFLMILLPLAGCIILGVKLHRQNKLTEQMTDQISFLEQALLDTVDERDRLQALLRIGEPDVQEYKEAEKEEKAEDISELNAEPADGLRKVYLTFDDGPSPNTEELLDILAEYNVKATFFVTGKNKEGYGDIYRRIVDEGHTLGMHSYSHEYHTIYASLENFQEDMETLQDFLYQETGTLSKFYRFPGGSSNKVSKTDIHELIDYLDTKDISYFDWNISGGDAAGVPVGSDQIINRVMSNMESHRVAVVLLHDAADKHSTVEALPGLIEKIRAMNDGTQILPITEDTEPIRHMSQE